MILSALFFLCIVRLWVMPLFSSFWVDEMATVFVVRQGAADPSLSVAPQVPASIYYAVARSSQWLFGGTEFAYRLPSVIAIALALWFIARLARRLIHPAATWFAVFACLALRDFNSQATDARPYALGICTAAAAFWILVRWLDSAQWRDAVLFALAAALLWRIHLVFWPMYIVFGLYAVVRIAAGSTAVTWKAAVMLFTAFGITLLPVARQALAINAHAAAHVVAPQPSFTELTESLKLVFVMSFCGITALLSRRFAWRSQERLISGPASALVFGWWLCPPLALFAFSHFTGHSIFVGRYLSVALPGIALAATAMAAAFVPSPYWGRLSMALGVAVLLFGGHWTRAFPLHHNSDWRDAALALNHEAAPDVPVICPSPFIEAKPPAWHPGYPPESFLYSHLFTYRVRGQALAFPFETSPEAEAYAASLSETVLPRAGRFLVYGGKANVLFWRSWFRARPELAGWHERPIGGFGDVAVVEFESPAFNTTAARSGSPKPRIF